MPYNEIIFNTIISSDTPDYSSLNPLFSPMTKFSTARDDMLGRLWDLLLLYLQGAFYLLLAECLGLLLFEVPMHSIADILLFPVLAVPVTDIIDVLAFSCISATASSFIGVLITFPYIAPDDLRDFMLDAFYHPPVAADTPAYDWQGNRPIYLSLHYGFMVFVLLFIFLCFAAGLMIQPEVPSWRPTYPSCVRSARVCTILRARVAKFLGDCSLTPSLALEWSFQTNQALFVVLCLAWLVLTVLLAAWTTTILATAIAVSSLLWSGVLSGLCSAAPTSTPCREGSTTEEQVLCWGQSPVLFLRSCTAGLAYWYDRMYEDDEMRHLPIFTIPIAAGLTANACKMLWQDKYQGLFKPEFPSEDTRLRNEVLLDYGTFLAGLVSKADEVKEVLVAMFGLLASALAQNKELCHRLLSLQAEISELEGKCERLPQYANAFYNATIAASSFHRKYLNLENQLDAYRRDADANMSRSKIQELTAHITALHQEAEVLRRDGLEREQELRSLRQEVSMATSRAKEAEQKADYLSKERFNQSIDVESLRQQCSELSIVCGQLSTDKQNLAQQLQEAKNQAQLADNRSSNAQSALEAAEQRVGSLLTELAAKTAQHDSCVNELSETTQQLDITKATLKFQSEELGAVETELADKSTAVEQLTSALRQAELRLAQLEPSAASQVIHDQRKQNEVRQLRDKLDKERADNRVLRENKSQLESELSKLRSQAMGPSPSASLSCSQSETDPMVERLRAELRDKDAELQRVTIQLSNARLATKGAGSNPFMPPRRR